VNLVIDHLSLGVRDLASAKGFYDAALAPLGLRAEKVTESHVGYVRGGRDDFYLIREARAGAAGPAQHVAFLAPSRAAVAAFHAAALRAGGKDDGGPGVRPEYHSGYFAAFVRDPDGNRIEAVHHARAAVGVRPMQEFDIFLPRCSPERVEGYKKRLRERFGGVTYMPQKNEGEWTLGAATFKDDISILRVVTAEGEDAVRALQALKADMERELAQEEILIICRAVSAL
jgi:catechol 2,3-dioxygenase-like lactoylglutathione lyase family enzyme